MPQSRLLVPSPQVFFIAVAVLLIIAVGFFVSVSRGWFGAPLTSLKGSPRPVAATVLGHQSPPALAEAGMQILFGDLHAHTNISADAYLQTMPLLSGDGVHPVSDACDFARYCSALDFWSINDHAGSITPQLWQQTKQAVRECNARTSPKNPDMVAFLGYEWTQIGDTPEDHYGHKNVVFPDTADDQTPTHPVAAKNPTLSIKNYLPDNRIRALLPLLDPANARQYMDYNRYVQEFINTPDCPLGTPYQQLGEDCIAYAKTPAQLFELLDQWGGDSLVIPHGNSWGLYTPRGVSWDKQLQGGMHDEQRQRLMEIYSGHGNSEEYRSWRHVTVAADGSSSCPERSDTFYPGCQRAGDIILERCVAEGIDLLECDSRAEQARLDFLASTPEVIDYLSIPGTEMEDWQDSQQCNDCFQPGYRYRPGGSAQYAMAIRNFDEAGEPRRFHFGFIGSSDNHLARPGTGYKEFERRLMTDAPGYANPGLRELIRPEAEEPEAHSRVWTMAQDMARSESEGLAMEFERGASFFYTGGLVAVIAESRRREDIWQALKQRRVYATSGERIQLSFSLAAAAGPVLMGGEARQSHNPRFHVQAVGDFKQQPGCPDYSFSGLGVDNVNRLCRGECYHPSDQRNLITRIEVIRVRPQEYAGEPLDNLVEDVWKSFPCPPDPSGCRVEFEDAEFASLKRDTLYYVRAISEPKPMINGRPLNLEYDDSGRYSGMTPCPASSNSDCLAENEPRAWSSPIFVDYGEPL